jgi:hypothetical protein
VHYRIKVTTQELTSTGVCAEAGFRRHSENGAQLKDARVTVTHARDADQPAAQRRVMDVDRVGELVLPVGGVLDCALKALRDHGRLHNNNNRRCAMNSRFEPQV